MRRFTTVILILSGTMFSAFIFVLGLYAASPGFREQLTGAVAGDSDIPVIRNDAVAVDMNKDIQEAKEQEAEETEAASPSDDIDPSMILMDLGHDEETALSSEATSDGRYIVDKEYHEDCGTGEGYWVITYSDGSTKIE